MHARLLLSLFLLLFSATLGLSQTNLAIGQWRAILPYNTGLVIAQSPDHVYYATSQSLVQVDKADLSPRFYSRVEGLSENGISQLAYSERFNTLVIGYGSGNIDLLTSGGVFNINDIATNTNITGEKEIYDIYLVEDSLAVLSCGFGIVQLNLATRLFEQTAFTGSRVFQSTVLQGSVYAATEDGVYRLPPGGFFPNFLSWERLGPDDGFPGGYFASGLATQGDDLFVGVNDTLFRWDGSSLTYQWTLPGQALRFITATAGHVLAGAAPSGNAGSLFLIRPDGTTVTYQAGCVGQVRGGVIDQTSRCWLADDWLQFRIIDLTNNGCTTLDFQSPFNFSSSEITVVGDSVYIASGTIAENLSPAQNGSGVYTRKAGVWQNYNFFGYPEMSQQQAHLDLNTLYVDPADGTIYAGSYWGGLVVIQGESLTFYQQQNSALQGTVGDSQRERIGGVVRDQNGHLWIANTQAENPLVLWSANDEWQAFRPSSNTQLLKGLVDQQNNKWFVLGSGGVLVYNEGADLLSPSDDQVRIFSAGSGNLPSNKVRSIGLDLDGEVWVGTDDGVGVIRCGDVFDPEFCQASRIIVTQEGITEALLNDEQIRAIAVDGANRKWLGTRNGLFVQSPDGRTEVARFNERNSPLFSDRITTLAFDPNTGEMWIGTEKGILTYQTDAPAGGDVHASPVSVYPNPVRPDYQGPIAIKGLPRDANVKITDIRGRLVFEGDALGGQAIWDGRDYTGERVHSGVYLVFSTSDNPFGDPDTAVSRIVFIR